MITVFTTGGKNPFYAATTDDLITLQQATTGRKLFTVTYGLEVKSGLNHDLACAALGSAILHNARCEGKCVD